MVLDGGDLQVGIETGPVTAAEDEDGEAKGAEEELSVEEMAMGG